MFANDLQVDIGHPNLNASTPTSTRPIKPMPRQSQPPSPAPNRNPQTLQDVLSLPPRTTGYIGLNSMVSKLSEPTMSPTDAYKVMPPEAAETEELRDAMKAEMGDYLQYAPELAEAYEMVVDPVEEPFVVLGKRWIKDEEDEEAPHDHEHDGHNDDDDDEYIEQPVAAPSTRRHSSPPPLKRTRRSSKSSRSPAPRPPKKSRKRNLQAGIERTHTCLFNCEQLFGTAFEVRRHQDEDHARLEARAIFELDDDLPVIPKEYPFFFLYIQRDKDRWWSKDFQSYKDQMKVMYGDEKIDQLGPLGLTLNAYAEMVWLKFQCDICGLNFSRVDSMKRHRGARHK